MPHAALCVSRPQACRSPQGAQSGFNAARSMMCVGTCFKGFPMLNEVFGFNAARSMMCVGTSLTVETTFSSLRFQCRTQHDVCWDTSSMLRALSLQFRFNAARSMMCVGTLSSPALVPRGLRRHFGKTHFFAPFLASADELCPEKWGSHRRCPLCGAGCTVLERRNGGMRLCARAGALSISFSSYLMIAHASFFFNDVFASMQRGR